MNHFSIILLRKSGNGVRQWHLGTKTALFLGTLLIFGGGYLGLTFHQQNTLLAKQQSIIFEQESTQAELQRKLDLYDGQESRIQFLEDYVEELKQTAHSNETAYRKHLALTQTATDSLLELHDLMCGELQASCIPNPYDQEDPRQQVLWMSHLQQNLVSLSEQFRDTLSSRQAYEEQASEIEQLRSQLTKAEQDLAEHLAYMQSRSTTVERLAERISQTTGINLTKDMGELQQSSGKGNRGGPTMMDELSLEAPEQFLLQGNLRNFLYQNSQGFESSIRDFEDISEMVAHNETYWKQTPTIIPVRSRLLSDRYGMRRDPFTKKRTFHAGLDFVARTGAKLFAPADGIVRLAKSHFGYGLMVELDHGRGFYPGKRQTVRYRTRYAHLSKILVKKGQRIRRGEMIGLVGNTGRSTGPHLHYEVLVNNRKADPLLFISRFNPGSRLYVR
jgi:murein DD-endopeptidase MepM/ murein hydrolase activator NlpD